MAKGGRIFSLFLRFLALCATVAALVIMVTSHESIEVLNLTFDAKYRYTPAFVYFVIAEGIGGVYSFTTMLLSCKSCLRRLIVLMDVVIAILLGSSISAAVAIGQVGKNGNSHAGWLPICEQVPKFCDKVTGSLIAGFAAAALYLIILLHSLRNELSPLFIVST